MRCDSHTTHVYKLELLRADPVDKQVQHVLDVNNMLYEMWHTAHVYKPELDPVHKQIQHNVML